MSAAPRVSVVLPVYNGQEYLLEAIDSVLSQTFTDFELIVIDDGSTDGTRQLLAGLSDPRLRLFHQTNMGLALTLNKGISLARGAYIARQDADDISRPERLARQVAYLDENPECALLGTWSLIQEDRVRTMRGHQHPSANGELQIRLLFDSFFVHSSVMMRRSALDRSGFYPTDPERNPPEDFDLWLRIARDHRIANLPEPLLVYREVPGSISRTRAALLDRRAVSIAVENLVALLDDPGAQPELCDLVKLIRRSTEGSPARPHWRSLERLLRRIEARLASRWPNDAADLARGAAWLHADLQRVRVRNSWIGRGAFKLRALVRRLGPVGSSSTCS